MKQRVLNNRHVAPEAGGGRETSGGENRLSSPSFPVFIWIFLMFGIL
ncbi:BnaA08g05210D [Brassica napus]|uniref:(rape) hypothetical protein n=1 Tax=Brassica napus TaxID=3708 RepID=A0A078I272_BRANA|nr:unnamed protein product [Brassica napus]CDY43699.1 BnaA08g05210D [Brassica napus]